MSEPATDEEIEHLERTGKLPSTLRLIARIRQQQKVIATLTPPPSALVEGGEPVAWTTQAQLDKVKENLGNNVLMWGEPLPYHPDIPLYTTPPSRNDTIRECISVADNNYYEKLSAANRWFEQGDQGSAIVCRDQARACRDISTALRALLTDEVANG